MQISFTRILKSETEIILCLLGSPKLDVSLFLIIYNHFTAHNSEHLFSNKMHHIIHQICYSVVQELVL